MRALAVTTIKRSQAARDIPTIDEAGVRGYDANAWFGVLAGFPQDVQDDILGRTARRVYRLEED